MRGEFVVLVDTREQRPWRLRYPCLPITLDAGDYTIRGAEKRFRIERKGKPSEFARNCGGDWPRFSAALARLRAYTHRAIVCDFTMHDIMAARWPGAITPDVILGRMSEIMCEMQIPILLAGAHGRRVAETLMVRYWARQGRRRQKGRRR
jgi:hypothetical protein